MKKIIVWCVVSLGMGLVACAPSDDGTQPALGSGVDLEHMDRGVRPQDDFFRYVNGGWLANTDMPADRSRWGVFDGLRDQAEQHVLAIVQEAAAREAEPGTEARKIGDMY